MSISAQTIRLGIPGVYTPCLRQPAFEAYHIQRPEIVKPNILRPEMQVTEIVKPTLLKPTMILPEMERPTFIRPEYDNRCDMYRPSAFVLDGVDLGTPVAGDTERNLRIAKSFATVQQVLARTKTTTVAASGKSKPVTLAGAMAAVAKMDSSDCPCGTTAGPANAPVVIRR